MIKEKVINEIIIIIKWICSSEQSKKIINKETYGYWINQN